MAYRCRITSITLFTIKNSTYRALTTSTINIEISLDTSTTYAIPLLILVTLCRINTCQSSFIPYITIYAISSRWSTLITIPVMTWRAIYTFLVFRIKSIITSAIYSIEYRVSRTKIILIIFLAYITYSAVSIFANAIITSPYLIFSTISLNLASTIRPNCPRLTTFTRLWNMVPITIWIRALILWNV